MDGRVRRGRVKFKIIVSDHLSGGKDVKIRNRVNELEISNKHTEETVISSTITVN